MDQDATTDAEELACLRERAGVRTRPGGDLPEPPCFLTDGLAVARSPAIDARLQVWLSPAFPVGGFAFSHGLELAAERGWIASRGDLEAWLRDLIEVGSVRSDCILLAAAWRAARAGDAVRLREAGELALALQPSAERYLESVTQGGAFLATVSAAWPADGLAASVAALDEDVALPVAVAVSAAAHAIALDGTLTAFALGGVGNLVSAAIRLSLVGQTDGQRVVAQLMAPIQRTVAMALDSSLSDIGGVALRSDLASLMHETQYSRLFRS